MNKKDAEFNSASFYSGHFFGPSRHFRDIERFGKYFPKNIQYLENGESDQKSVANNKDAELNSASFLFATIFFIRVAILEIFSVLKNIFPKMVNISKTANRIKKMS